MKKTILLACLALTFQAFSQEVPKKEDTKSIYTRKHEISIGGIKLLAGPILETSYEYIYSKDLTFGSSMQFNLKNSNYVENFSVTPYARFYFQESKEYGANGFFVEGFGKIYRGKNTLEFYIHEEEMKSFTASALGLGLGQKWINNSGFVFELLVGVGRVLGNSTVAPEVVFRGDLSIGYRF